MNMKEVTVNTKLKIYRAIYRSIYTNIWYRIMGTHRIRAVEIKYLRRVKGITKLDRLRNETIRTDFNIKGVEKRQLRWWGHLIRMHDDVPVKKGIAEQNILDVKGWYTENDLYSKDTNSKKRDMARGETNNMR